MRDLLPSFSLEITDFDFNVVAIEIQSGLSFTQNFIGNHSEMASLFQEFLGLCLSLSYPGWGSQWGPSNTLHNIDLCWTLARLSFSFPLVLSGLMNEADTNHSNFCSLDCKHLRSPSNRKSVSPFLDNFAKGWRGQMILALFHCLTAELRKYLMYTTHEANQLTESHNADPDLNLQFDIPLHHSK